MAKYHIYIRMTHLFFIICFMAGIFYLPRLFVYHSESQPDSESDKLLSIMESKLMTIIMLPASIITFITGSMLVAIHGIQPLWVKIKIVLAITMFIYYGILIKYKLINIKYKRHWSSRSLRIFNEIPGVILIGIVLLSLIK